MGFDDRGIYMNWGGKEVLITGAAGFIGSNLSKKLKIRGAQLTCVDDLSFGKEENFMTDKKIIMDVSTIEFLKNFQNKSFDYIFHFGAPCTVRQFQDNPTLSVKKTLVGFENVLRLAEHGEAKLIYPSSGNVYGKANNIEHSTPQPNNLYAICKFTTEKMAIRSSIKNIGLRIFAGYGPGESHKGSYASVVTIFLKKMLKGESPVIWGDGNQTRDFVYIKDITDSIIKAAESPFVFPVINIGTGKSISFNKLIDIINNTLQTEIKPKYIKKPKNYVQETKADISLMKKHLGIKPRNLIGGIEEYLNIRERKI